MVKSFKFIVKTMVFEGLAGCVREQKGIRQTSNMKPESIYKSIQNRCEHDAQKKDAKRMENCAKIDPTR